jgi:hypothetical protein
MLRIITFVAACVIACAAMPASAQQRGSEECWNPRAGHFEAVRPGERQNDLDFSHCRIRGYSRDNWRNDEARECWNPGARHFEAVRPGERQDDLDFSRCHPAGGRSNRDNRDNRDDRDRECWNPRAGHYEAVRPGERQDDLDFNRCRRR